MITDPLDGPKLEPRLERDVRYRPLRDAHEPTRVEDAEGVTDRVGRFSSIVRVQLDHGQVILLQMQLFVGHHDDFCGTFALQGFQPLALLIL